MLQFVLLAAAMGAAPRDSASLQSSLKIRGARILAPSGDSWTTGHELELRGETIAAVGTDLGAGEPDTASLDLEGMYLVPGLIDLHSHLLLHPYDETSWNDQVLKESLEYRTIRATASARATLHAGFTTLRELGTEGAAFADVALRDAIADGIVEGPRIFAATRALVATGCYGPAGFDPRWELPKGAQVADGVTGVRVATREQIAAGADWIKVYADYRRRPGDASTPTFSQAELQSIVDEAHSAGLPVAAHAVTDEAIRRSVEAGVSTIEHGTYATSEILALMARRGVVLCPTLAAAESIARYSGWDPSQEDHPRVAAARTLMTRALAAGVTIACGSDVGVFTHGENARELVLMQDYGMPAADVVRSATSIAAQVLGRGDELGQIRPGFAADLVAVRADPLEDVRALKEPVLVIHRGRVVVDRRAER